MPQNFLFIANFCLSYGRNFNFPKFYMAQYGNYRSILPSVLRHVWYKYKPSWSLPSSAAWPVGKMVLTKMPILPFGESRPPTMENPRLFFPGPFSNTTVWNELGRVLFTKWWPLLPLFLFRGNVQNGSGLISDIGSPPPRWCCSEEWPSKFAIIGKKKNIFKVWFHEILLVLEKVCTCNFTKFLLQQ